MNSGSFVSVNCLHTDPLSRFPVDESVSATDFFWICHCGANCRVFAFQDSRPLAT